MADDLVALCWAQRRSATDFAAAARAAVDSAEPAQRADVQRSLVAQLLEGACVGDEPSALLVDYLEHGMMLDALPINSCLRQLLDSPLLAVAWPVRLRSLLPVLHSFAPHVMPDDEAAAELVLQLLLRLAEVEAAGVGADAAVAAARALLGGQAALPLLALGRQAHPAAWRLLLQRVREPSAAGKALGLAQPLASALARVGLRLEDGETVPPRTESLALHDDDIGFAGKLALDGGHDNEEEEEEEEDDGDGDGVERRRRVRARLEGWGSSRANGTGGSGNSSKGALPLPRRRAEVHAAVSNALVSVLSAAAADGQKGPKPLGAAVCNAVSATTRRVRDVLVSRQPVPWHEARALAQLMVAIVSSAVNPAAVSAAVAAAALNQAGGGFSPEKEALKTTVSP
jgi:hypothetical protein